MIPSGVVRWVLPITALGMSCAFAIRNFYPIFAKDPTTGQQATWSLRTKQVSGGTIVMALVVAVEIALACVFKFVLMNYPEIIIITVPSPGSNGTAPTANKTL